MTHHTHPDLPAEVLARSARPKRGGWRVPILITIGVIVAWVALLTVGRPAWQRAVRQYQLVSAWERCNAAVAPAHEIIWEEDPDAGDLLQTQVWRYEPAINGQQLVATIRKTPPDRARLMAMLGRREPPAGPTLFMHERTPPSADGLPVQRQLLLIDVVSTRGNRLAPNTWAFDSLCILPSPLGDLRVYENTLSVDVPEWINATRHYVRFYAGQVDLFDDSHFEITYAVNGEPGTIDGWLADSGRPVLRVRDGPAVDAVPEAPSDAPSDPSPNDPP